MMKFAFTIFITFYLADFSSAQDWANLNRFKIDNTEIGMPKARKHRVVFMGNSITEGWLSIRPEFFAGKPYVNRGIGGQTTPQMLLRFRQDVIDLQPAVVVILAGINDIAGNTGPSTIAMITDNIFSMAELARAHNIKVVLCSVLPAADLSWNPGLKPAEKVIELNTRIKAYAIKHNMGYVDYFTPMANEANGLKTKLGEDGVHPNAAGYAIMEPLVEEALVEVLN